MIYFDMIMVIIYGFKRESDLLKILPEIFTNEMTAYLGFASIILGRRRSG